MIVKCSQCGYEWENFAARLLLTCPNCEKKIHRVEDEG